MEKDSQQVRITDLSCSAFLHYNNFPFVIERSKNGKCVFCFDNKDSKAANLANFFWSGQEVSISPLRLLNATKNLKTIIFSHSH